MADPGGSFQGVAQSISSLGDLIHQRRQMERETAFDMLMYQKFQQDKMMQQHQMDQMERQGRIAEQKAKREQEQYEQGEQLLDPMDYLSPSQHGQEAVDLMLQHARERGFLEKQPNGQELIRRRNVQSAMTAQANDPIHNQAVGNAKLKHINAQLDELRTKIDEKPDEKTQAKVDQLIQQKTLLNTQLDFINKKMAKETAIPSLITGQYGVAKEEVKQKGTEKVTEMKEAGAKERELIKSADRRYAADKRYQGLTEAAKLKVAGAHQLLKEKYKHENFALAGVSSDGTQVALFDRNSGKAIMVTPDTGEDEEIDPSAYNIMKQIFPNFQIPTPKGKPKPTIEKVPGKTETSKAKIVEELEGIFGPKK